MGNRAVITTSTTTEGFGIYLHLNGGPVIQMQQKELELKEADLQRKTAKDQTDAALKAAQIEKTDERERERIKAQTSIEGAKIGVEVAKHKEDVSMKQAIEGAKLGVQIGTSRLPNK